MAITVQKVSGAMRRARVPASTSSSTRIRGWRDYTSGVCVYRAMDGNVCAYWVTGNHYIRETPEMRAKNLKKITNALDAVGIKYTVKDDRAVIEANQ
jgi:hypothetical protein